MNSATAYALSGILLGLLPATTLAADWPQFRGPGRNGISAETGWEAKWPASGPKRLWTAQVGQGYSSMAVVGGRLYTMGNVNEQDVVTCLDALTGKVLWTHRYPCPSGDYSGPRATPTVSGGKVYTLSRQGQAFCLNAQTGKVLWQRDLMQQTGAQPPNWGFSGSPLIEGELVIYNMNARGVALDKNSGRLVWNSGAGAAGYATPVPFTQGGKRLVGVFNASALVAVDPANGRPVWQHPWQTQFGVNAADPIFSGTEVFISSNYNRGGTVLRFGGARPEVVWENRNMRNHTNGCVLVGGALYGNDQGSLKCVDWRTGNERWRTPGFGRGGLIAAANKLIVLTERGDLLILAANPAKYTELARAKVLNGECWIQPVLANGLLYCRNHEGALVCLDLRVQ